MADGIKWGEDLERDCQEMRKLESWGIYPAGYHDANCTIHDKVWIGEYDTTAEDPNAGMPVLTITPQSELLVQTFAENTMPSIIYFFVNLDTTI